jgi:hypothetical protein
MHRLSAACQRMVQNASVLQRSFSLMVLELMEEGRSSVGNDLLTLLEEALKADILVEEGTGENVGYRYWHPLLVDYLYESLSATRRTLGS